MVLQCSCSSLPALGSRLVLIMLSNRQRHAPNMSSSNNSCVAAARRFKIPGSPGLQAPLQKP